MNPLRPTVCWVDSVVELTVLTNHSQYPLDRIWWIGPVWQWNGHFVPVLETENTLSLSQEDLGKVAKTAVFLEEDTKHGKKFRCNPPIPKLRQWFRRRQSVPQAWRVTKKG